MKYHHSFDWSLDGEQWHSVPGLIHLEMRPGFAFDKLTKQGIASTVELWSSGADEPIAHELFQEAWSQINQNPRSSLVVGIAAAETGLKHLVSKSTPVAGWLVENLPSPPLVRMLREYLPLLPSTIKINGRSLALPDWLLATLEKGVSLRNKVVHGQDVSLKYDTLQEILWAVNDILYFYDLVLGHRWAAKRLSHRLVLSLKGES